MMISTNIIKQFWLLASEIAMTIMVKNAQDSEHDDENPFDAITQPWWNGNLADNINEKAL